MKAYLFKRLFLMIPTLIGIITINFFLVQAAPGGPVETMLARISGDEVTAAERAMRQDDTSSEKTTIDESSDIAGKYKGSEGISPEVIKEIEKLYNFDKPVHVRYFMMLRDYLFFDFGDSFFRDKSVIQMIKEKLPVSVSLGLWSTIIIYFVSIPLGIKKAVKHGTAYDVWSSFIVVLASAIPMFLFAIILIIFFAGGNFFSFFPLRGLVSNNFADLTMTGKILDYLWHIFLPILTMVIGGFAGLTMLTKNSFLEEIGKQYVMTARSKGLNENRILYGHIFRNAMLIVISGFPAAFVSIFFTGSLMIEVIYSLDGIGLMGFEAVISRDYSVMFATLYISTLMGLTLSIISDITYTLIDPRISFKSSSNG